MKVLQCILLLLFCLHYSLAQPARVRDKCDYSGCIGDVKYSILPPEDFRDLNGKGWVLMAGQQLDTSRVSEHYSPYLHGKMASLPDARGYFIRAMNYNGGVDPFPTEKTQNRLVGEPQDDKVKSHTHQHQDAYFSEIQGGNQHLLGNQGDSDRDNGRIWNWQTTEANTDAGVETRPRNIALYLYVKIRNE